MEGETIDVPLNPAAATDSLDGLAKEIYCRAFDWLVAKINESTSCAKGAVSGTIDLLVRLANPRDGYGEGLACLFDWMLTSGWYRVNNTLACVCRGNWAFRGLQKLLIFFYPLHLTYWCNSHFAVRVFCHDSVIFISGSF